MSWKPDFWWLGYLEWVLPQLASLFPSVTIKERQSLPGGCSVHLRPESALGKCCFPFDYYKWELRETVFGLNQIVFLQSNSGGEGKGLVAERRSSARSLEISLWDLLLFWIRKSVSVTICRTQMLYQKLLTYQAGFLHEAKICAILIGK